MEEFSFLKIIEKAFWNSWKNRFLWLFGFLIFLGTIASNVNFKNKEGVSKQFEDIDLISAFIFNHPLLIEMLLFAWIIFVIGAFFVKYIGKISLIKSLNDIDLYKQFSFKIIFNQAREYFWKIVLLELAISLFVATILVVLALPVSYLFKLNSNSIAIAMTILAIAITVPILILAYYIYEYAVYFIILGNIKASLALELAFGLFRNNTKKSLQMGMVNIISFAMFVLALIVSIGIILLMLSPIGFGLNAMFANSGLIGFLIFAFLFESVFVCLAFSWYFVFVQAMWLAFFQEITIGKIEKEKKALEKEQAGADGKLPTPEAV